MGLKLPGTIVVLAVGAYFLGNIGVFLFEIVESTGLFTSSPATDKAVSKISLVVGAIIMLFFVRKLRWDRRSYYD